MKQGAINTDRAVSLVGFIQVIALIIFALSLVSLSGSSLWLLELTSHFRLAYLAGSLVCFLLFALMRHYRSALIMFLVTVVNVACVVPIYSNLQTVPVQTRSAELTIFHANVNSQNRQYQLLKQAVMQEQPDIIVLQEITPGWLDNMQLLLNDYLFQKLVARRDNFGIALLSKLKFQTAEVISLGDVGLPSIKVKLLIGNQSVNLLATHPLPPITPAMKGLRDAQLDALAVLVTKLEKPTIVVGDLNTTHWSPSYKRLLDKTRLTNASQGRGIFATWPSGLSVIGLPIDHILLSDRMEVVDIHTVSDIGSDHLPLVARLRYWYD